MSAPDLQPPITPPSVVPPVVQQVERVRVLHVLGGLVRGGAESWLMQVLRQADRERFQIDFLVHRREPGEYEPEARGLGCRVFRCPDPHRPRLYARRLSAILRQHGPFDIVHSHVHYFSGFVLRVADRAGTPVRIAHSHSDTSPQDAAAGLARKAYLGWMRHWLRQHATLGLATSHEAAAALFGVHWSRDPRWQLLFCGVDLQPFHEPVDRAAVRASLGIPADAFVIGHVGRFEPVKNHRFLIDVFAEVHRRDPRWRLLLVGDGSQRPAIESAIREKSLAGHVSLPGLRGDVARIMKGAMDVFLFPSLYEGLPLAVVEAQAAGLLCFVSDTVTRDVRVVEPLVRYASLQEPAAQWADAVLAGRPGERPLDPDVARRQLERSPLNIVASVEHLESAYWRALHSGSLPAPCAANRTP